MKKITLLLALISHLVTPLFAQNFEDQFMFLKAPQIPGPEVAKRNEEHNKETVNKSQLIINTLFKYTHKKKFVPLKYTELARKVKYLDELSCDIETRAPLDLNQFQKSLTEGDTKQTTKDFFNYLKPSPQETTFKETYQQIKKNLWHHFQMRNMLLDFQIPRAMSETLQANEELLSKLQENYFSYTLKTIETLNHFQAFYRSKCTMLNGKLFLSCWKLRSKPMIYLPAGSYTDIFVRSLEFEDEIEIELTHVDDVEAVKIWSKKKSISRYPLEFKRNEDESANPCVTQSE